MIKAVATGDLFIGKRGDYMLRNMPKLDSGFDDFLPDAYDEEGHRTINSWELFKQDELASEDDD